MDLCAEDLARGAEYSAVHPLPRASLPECLPELIRLQTLSAREWTLARRCHGFLLAKTDKPAPHARLCRSRHSLAEAPVVQLAIRPYLAG